MLRAPRLHDRRTGPISQIEISARHGLAQEEPTSELMAAMHRPVPGAVKLRPEQERELFHLRDGTQDEQALWASAGFPPGASKADLLRWANDDLTADEVLSLQHAGVDRERFVADINAAFAGIRDKLYPHRMKVVQAGERKRSLPKRLRFIKRMQQAGPPTPAAPPTPPGQADVHLGDLPNVALQDVFRHDIGSGPMVHAAVQQAEQQQAPEGQP